MTARVVGLALAITLLIVGPGSAKVPSYDYYGDRYPRGLLVNVEKWHLGEAREKIAKGLYVYASGDVAFMLNRFPNHPKALLLAIDLSFRWPGHTYWGEHHLKQALDSYPNHGQTWVVYGLYQHRLGKLEKAVELYRTALSLDSELPNAYYNLGLALVELERYDEARSAAIKAYKLGYPLPGLKNKLKEVGAWNASGANAD